MWICVQTAEISVILPVKDIEKEIVGILRFAMEQTEGIDSELIVVDMGSSDRTVLQAVRLIKDMGLHGFVIQNGDSSVPAALNTGLQKADGNYLTFVFARRLYESFLLPCLETAKRTKADFVFGCDDKDEIRAAERRTLSSAIQRRGGAQYLKDSFRRGAPIDISAVLIRRGFLLEKQIEFEESCRYGYSEEFVSRCLLCAEAVVQAPVLLRRNDTVELRRGKQSQAGTAIFQRVDAVLRVADLARTVCAGDAEMIRLLERIKLPLAVMDAVDILLREGNDSRTVRGCLQSLGYDRFLTVDRRMDPKLRRRILIWRFTPGLYRPG